jgi:hypothetical protein
MMYNTFSECWREDTYLAHRDMLMYQVSYLIGDLLWVFCLSSRQTSHLDTHFMHGDITCALHLFTTAHIPSKSIFKSTFEEWSQYLLCHFELVSYSQDHYSLLLWGMLQDLPKLLSGHARFAPYAWSAPIFRISRKAKSAEYSVLKHPFPARAEYKAPAALRHELWQDGDEDPPSSILDSNGQVVLSLCKVCGRAESELASECIRDLTSSEI